MTDLRRFAVQDVARIYRVPEWLITGHKPSIWRHPLRRLRGWWWTHTS